MEYKENNALGIRRGDYVAVRVFSGEKKLTGSYIDILNPELKLVENPVVPAGKCALYKDVSNEMQGQVKILHTSCRIDDMSMKGHEASIKLSGPQDTRGVVRVFTPPGCFGDIVSISIDDKEIDLKKLIAGNGADESTGDIKTKLEGYTSLVSFDNKPDSVTLSIVWR
ncbi:MAG: hypothetical protein GX139_11580 [Armatimonadetes bacterium]|nr:hypothetical protein [Armatimonadota bacterium]